MKHADVEIRHEPEQQRFVADIAESDAPAVLEYRPLGDRELEYYRTFTPIAHRGRGIAERLVAHALDYALDSGLRVVPSCPFVAKVIGSDAKYAPVVARPRDDY